MLKEVMILQSEIKMPLLKLPVKTTLIRIGEKVVMISPVPQIHEFKEEIEGFGTPTDIVAPSAFHHLGINKAAQLYPDAKIWGVPAVCSKRSDVNWHYVLPGGWPYGNELRAIFLRGMPKIDEVVFYHKPSKTLIVADLVFNHIHGKGIGNWLIFNLFGTYKKFGISKFFMKFIKNKTEFLRSVEELLSLDIETIIVSHGVDIVQGGNDQLRQAFEDRGLI